ncbi:phage Gp37/Gp68 family protein [Mesorhizobium sp. AD1-1]|uniref:phage Gp37/Gp68 family protein n=1 Tax=Mesorhizobium sp. AD1-1 TaxID=2876621 RepID=UPI001CCD1598|nr:phage Gp37/Gp68 family protein [Mesorhizobium sp. AD1-1]MBZ9719134.1 phage Gp37/Gp68 family protein [Mesorhizobium sp. AD1-1]
MADKSGIEWTDATWNPIVGCSILSPGCTRCYAMRMAARIEAMGSAKHYDGTTKKVNGNAVWTGKLALAPVKTLMQPLLWKRPRRIFVNSMGDLFHEDVPDEWIDQTFAVMAVTPHHTYQPLTKRANRMRRYLSDPATKRRVYEIACDLVIEREIQVVLIASGMDERCAPTGPRVHLDQWPLPNVWLGVSAERQQEADERIPELVATPAAIRFVSAEPLLGPIDFTHLQPGDPPVEIDALNGTHGVLRPHGGRSERLDWIIVGGESGPDARPMHPAWPRAIRDQCQAAGVPFFFKQWGEWARHKGSPGGDLGGDVRAGRVRIVHPSAKTDVEVFEATGGRNTEQGSLYMGKVGKKAAGRLLDGVEHNGMPGPIEVPAL